MTVIEVTRLKKFYGNVRAVNGVNFKVNEGEIFGLLGPNGAGKTTTLEMLEGLKRPDSGEIKILGLDGRRQLDQVRKRIGVVLQSGGFFPELKLLELLRLFASFYPASGAEKNIPELIERFALEQIIDRTFQQLSGGQRQRFVLATALLHKPKVLFLDEPTIGLDPAVRQKFWDVISSLRRGGMTILLTTHYMEEAESLCDHVGIIDHGRILVTDKPIRLINSLGIVSRIKFMSSKPINLTQLQNLPGVLSARQDRYRYDLETDTPEETLRQLLTWEHEFSGRIFNLSVRQATLEDVFLKLTGRSLRE